MNIPCFDGFVLNYQLTQLFYRKCWNKVIDTESITYNLRVNDYWIKDCLNNINLFNGLRNEMANAMASSEKDKDNNSKKRKLNVPEASITNRFDNFKQRADKIGVTMADFIRVVKNDFVKGKKGNKIDKTEIFVPLVI